MDSIKKVYGLSFGQPMFKKALGLAIISREDFNTGVVPPQDLAEVFSNVWELDVQAIEDARIALEKIAPTFNIPENSGRLYGVRGIFVNDMLDLYVDEYVEIREIGNQYTTHEYSQTYRITVQEDQPDARA